MKSRTVLATLLLALAATNRAGHCPAADVTRLRADNLEWNAGYSFDL